MDRNKVRHDPHHLGVPSGVSKWFMSLSYIRRKLCTNLVSRLALCPNEPRQAFTWASSPRSTIGCIQNDFSVWRKMCTCLALTLTPYPNGLKQDLTWPTSHTSSIGCVQNNSEPMVRSAQTVHPSRIKISTISKWTETNFHLSLVI
jgi:hypothetical protein